MNDRILLIFPKIGNVNKKPDRPPLGILTVAAPLVEKGIRVIILDERAEKRFDEKLLNEIAKDPICAGISSMSGRQITYALRVSSIIKERSTIPVVWGGVQATLEPESTLKNELIDYIVRDDGEETFLQLVEVFQGARKSLDDIDISGIGYKKNGRLIFTGTSKPADIDKIPLIPFYLINLRNYAPDPKDSWASNNEPVIPIETSRGCPFSCIFCTESVRKKKWRALSPDRVINNIRQYKKLYGANNFTFIDDNMFGNIKRGEQIIEKMVEKRLNIRWYTNIRTDFVARADTQFLGKLEKSGCKMLTFGAESGSDSILKMINKKASLGDVATANRNLKKYDIIPHFVTIRGFPDETEEDLLRTFLLMIQLLLENRKAICDSPLLIVTPSTKIAEICLKESVKTFELEDWAKIFDFFEQEKPPWVLPETYRCIQEHELFIKIASKVNRCQGIMDKLYFIILHIYKICITVGYSGFLDGIIKRAVSYIK